MSPDEIRQELQNRGWSIRELAQRAGMEENHLTKSLGKAGRRLQVPEMDGIRRAFARDTEERAPIRHIPWPGKVPAGKPQQALERVNRFFPVSDPETPPRAYALTVEGDSMDLVVDSGTTLVIDPDDQELWPGEQYIIMTQDGETTYKEYQEEPARLVPLSSNAENREIALGSEPITVLGRVYSFTTRRPPRRRSRQ